MGVREDENRIDGENGGREFEKVCVWLTFELETRLVFGAQSLPFRLSVSSFRAQRGDRKRGRGSRKKGSKRLEQIRGERFCGATESLVHSSNFLKTEGSRKMEEVLHLMKKTILSSSKQQVLDKAARLSLDWSLLVAFSV